MKVLLINAPVRLDANPNCIPTGLAIIASLLRKEGHDVEIYDINALRPSIFEIKATLKEKGWDLVGVSGLITTYGFHLRIIPLLKEIRPHAPVVCGGGIASSSSGLLFRKTPLDIAVQGEGERTMSELCRTLESKADISAVKGLCYRHKEGLFSTSPRENIRDLDILPFPAWDLLPMDIYLKNPIWGNAANNSSGFRSDVHITRSMNIIASRGCPFSCAYCYHLFGRSSYRFRSPESVVGEMEALVNLYGVDFIGFVDDNMMASQSQLLALCDLLEKKRLPVTWGCHGRVTSAEPHILERMAETGCVWIGYGIESGSQRMLNAMNKKACVDQAKQAVRNTRKAGIFPNTTFIFGYPGETRETIQETVTFKRELGLTCGSFFATPYPQTPLYHQVQDRIPDEERFVKRLGNATEFTLNLTDFDDDTLFRLKRAMDENQDVIQAP